jgi:uncharacterized protein (DUF58 family)
MALPFAATVVFFAVAFAGVVATPFAIGFFVAAGVAPGLVFAAAALFASEAELVAAEDVSSARNCVQGQSSRPSNAQPRNFANLVTELAPTPAPQRAKPSLGLTPYYDSKPASSSLLRAGHA